MVNLPDVTAVQRLADAAAVSDPTTVATEAALSGKPAGQYNVTATGQLVAWNGSAVTARGAMPASATQLRGVTNQAQLGTPVNGPAGIPEMPPTNLTVTGTLRGERVTYGIGANAVLQSLSNMPGNRTQVTAVSDLAGIGIYGGIDHVTRFAEMVADPAIYNVPSSGNASYTATTVQATGIPWALLYDPQGNLRVGLIVGTSYSAPGWYGPVVAVNQATNTITVKEWRAWGTGATGTPPGGAPVLVNLMTKGWVDNANTIIPPGSPVKDAVIGEWGMQNLSGEDRPGLNGLDLVALFSGGKASGTALVIRNATGGNWTQGVAVQGPGVIGYSQEGNKVREYQALGNSQVGYYSQGAKNYHARYMASDGATELFAVTNEGNARVVGTLGVTGATSLGTLSTTGAATVGTTLTVGGALVARSQPVEVSFLDIHGNDNDGDYSARLTADPNSKRLLVNGAYVGTMAAAQSNVPAGASLADLITAHNNLLAALRASGLLAP